MRRALPLLLVLLVAREAFSASSFILFDRFGASWAPINGGPATKFLEGIPTDSATDGQRYLIAWLTTDGVHAGLFEPGSISPVAETILAPTFDVESPIHAVWDGSRYLVFWTGGAIGHAAVIDANGALVAKVDLPAIVSYDDVASNGDTIAVIRLFETSTHSGNAEVVLLDRDFAVLRRTLVGSIRRSTGSGITFLRLGTIARFGNGYYAVWLQERTSRYRDVVGTRITADGTALDVVPSFRETQSFMGRILDSHDSQSGNDIYEIELIQHRSRMIAVMKRPWGYEITATAVDASGAVEGPLHVAGTGGKTIMRADGTLALARIENEVAVIQPFSALNAAPRRRSSRH
jgi:hypothetical protein